MKEDEVIKIIKEKLSDKSLHSKTIEKFYRDFPEINTFVLKEIEKTPEYITKGYYAIMKVKNLTFQKCPNCGKLMDYERTYKNHRQFCCAACARENKLKNNGASNKKTKISNKIPLTNEIIFETISEEILYNLYKEEPVRKIVQLYRKSEQVRQLANNKFNENNNYRTPCNALISICHNIKLPICKYCGQEMKYPLHRNKTQLYCSIKCGRRGKTYIEKQQKSKYHYYYKNTVQLAKNKNLTLLTTIEDYNGLNGNNLYKCNKCLKEFIFKNSLNIRRDLKCPFCSSNSKFENEIKNFINKYEKIEVKNRKILKKSHELDIVIPDKKIAIECNGLYWHSTTINNDILYHLNKTKNCEEMNYKLIHIFEDEWLHRHTGVINLLQSSLGLNKIFIDQENCKIDKIGKNKAERFIVKYSLYLDYKDKINYSISYKNRIIGIISTDNNIITNISIMKNISIRNLEQFLMLNFKNYYYLHDKRFIYDFNFQFLKNIAPQKYYVCGTKRYLKKPARKTTYLIYDCGYDLYKI